VAVDQERGRRAGTENAAGIVGLGMACELAEVHMPIMSHLAELRDELQAGLLEKVPCSIVTGDIENRTPNTLNIAFEYIEGEAYFVDAESTWHRRFQWQCLHLWFVGTITRDACNEHSLYCCAWQRALLAVALHPSERDRLCAGKTTTGDRTSAFTVALLGAEQTGLGKNGRVCTGLRLTKSTHWFLYRWGLLAPYFLRVFIPQLRYFTLL